MKCPITKTIKTLRVRFLTGYVSLTMRNHDRLAVKTKLNPGRRVITSQWCVMDKIHQI